MSFNLWWDALTLQRHDRPRLNGQEWNLYKGQYTKSLASADFSSGVFTCVHFQKIAKIFRFSLHFWRNFYTHAFWVNNDLSAADLVHGDFCRTKKNAQAKDLVYIEQIVGIMIWMWLQKCLGIIVQVCKYILENCQKFYSSPPAIKCVKYLLPVLIFKSKTASQGGLSFFLSTQ